MTEISDDDLKALQSDQITARIEHHPMRVQVQGEGGAWVDVRQMATELRTLRRAVAEWAADGPETVEL